MIYFIGGLKHREFYYFDLVKKIKENNGNIQEFVFDIGIKEEKKFLEKINVNSIFSTEELIILKRAEKLKDIEKMLDYITNLDILNKEIIIDFSTEEKIITTKLTKKIKELEENKKIEASLFLKDSSSEVRNYVRDYLNISMKDVTNLIEMIGDNPFKVRNEVEKIKLYLGGDKFNIDEIKNIISIEKDYKIYESVQKILNNEAEEIITYLSKNKEYMGMLYSLYNELEVIYKISSLIKSGIKFSNNYNEFNKNFEEIKEVFRSNNRITNPYVVYKKIEYTKNYSLKSLKYLVYKCWETETNIKTGKIDMEIGVQNLIMEITKYYKK